ncbi:helix-turn-helix domain-containing protein [Kordiimonas sp. SCSIO 12610]|jgi:transcriptional regulator with XRE-family HTH domain|uniref:helix-turn-helix domain-containing protein n=1 Tax=Kordiimonas sp. SCSIO 12610 TaxID=2829597 RepID=UPI00210E3460|nr:helix-turn-helix transcriptional regulator [Kordiimonas sp. SCSIO 12610]UTW54165.1 helix-turn-helix transcriptional regulator [Kordiimonas sp. SCSIO 12610]
MLKTPDPIDVHVGQRVRARRKMLGLSQTELGNELGVTFQQVQKYERGTNRIGSSRLFKMSNTLDVPVAYFFEGAETKLPGYDEASVLDDDVFTKQETQELVEAYYRIADPRIRKKVLGLARLLSSGVDEYGM